MKRESKPKIKPEPKVEPKFEPKQKLKPKVISLRASQHVDGSYLTTFKSRDTDWIYGPSISFK